MKKKRFFASHAKSSAALISLGIHALIVVAAISFVAVQVIEKKDVVFEAKKQPRKTMKLKKLKVPMNTKKKVKPPKLRKRITVNPTIRKSMPDIKLPEMIGAKGSLSSASGSGLGGSAGVGFNMPEIKIFGVKTKGEKIFLILESSPEMMYDEMGGIPAYTIIKQELMRIAESLPPTALFNLCVYDGSKNRMLFDKMVPASSANAAKVREWITPLNAVAANAGSTQYGLGTLKKGLGTDQREFYDEGKFATYPCRDRWINPAMLAMKQQADTVYLLTCQWGYQKYTPEDNRSMSRSEWNQTSAGKKWNKAVQEGREMLKKENEERRKHGQPPRVLRTAEHVIVGTYFKDKGLQSPPQPTRLSYDPKEYAESMVLVKNKYRPKDVLSSGLSRKKKKMDFSFNVIRFVREDDDNPIETRFKKLTSMLKGQYKTIKGMAAIESYVSPSPDE